MFSCVIGSMMLAGMVAGLPAWEFNADNDLGGWVPNAHIGDLRMGGGEIEGKCVDWDPFFTLDNVEFPATAWQYVVLRIKTSEGGTGELFWSGQTTGEYGGLSAEKSTRFSVPDDGQWHDVIIRPFWQKEGAIRKMRLDLDPAWKFTIDYLRIMERPEQASSDSVWVFPEGGKEWFCEGAGDDLFAPPLRLDVRNMGWVSVNMTSDVAGAASLLWSDAGSFGLQRQNFAVFGDGQPHWYNVELRARKDWQDVVALGVRLPRGGKKDKVVLHEVRVSDAMQGPAELFVRYFGCEEGINRAGRENGVIALLENVGGTASTPITAKFEYPSWFLFPEFRSAEVPALDPGEQWLLRWPISDNETGPHKALLHIGDKLAQETELVFTASPDLPKGGYVPEPKPVPTAIDVCAYYFPGWDSDAKWDCIRRVAPIRKPVLGYYDESKVEVVDWQIKWAVENGVNCFLVDWYWCAGSQHLTHWFEAYRKAKYRDMLKVAIMWANHNPPNTHSVEDWRAVSREWVDRYFNLPAYYRVNGKPAIYMWDPNGLRRDLGGSETVRKCFEETDAMARAAGLPGVTFLTLNSSYAKSAIETLQKEGYYGITNYHEWGKVTDTANQDTKTERPDYRRVVDTVEETWAKKLGDARPLQYYPVVDTGWDSRPWHGENAFVIANRNAKDFHRLLKKARKFAEKNGLNSIILGPLNEWGEGSYIEPNTEFGFTMYEQVRSVFATSPKSSWQYNAGPSDVALGPYDFPVKKQTSRWTFEKGANGWKVMMGAGEPVFADGLMQFKTSSNDPAIVVDAAKLRARDFTKLVVTMRLSGSPTSAQLFWASGGTSTSEAASLHVPLITDGREHTYTFNLAENPRWRGTVTYLRLDPCGTINTDVAIREIALK